MRSIGPGSTLRYVLKHISAANQRLGAFLFLTAASILIFGYLWWGRFQYFHSAYLTGVQIGIVLLIVGNHWYFRDRLSELGLRIDNLAQALRQVLPLTGLVMLLVLLTATLAGEYRLERWEDLEVPRCNRWSSRIV